MAQAVRKSVPPVRVKTSTASLLMDQLVAAGMAEANVGGFVQDRGVRDAEPAAGIVSNNLTFTLLGIRTYQITNNGEHL
ncbi:MAG: hypothetical protein LWW75_08135 [Chlorobiales bacterium]|nr:hypothetical protein [Chlorobiales bacterium]